MKYLYPDSFLLMMGLALGDDALTGNADLPWPPLPWKCPGLICGGEVNEHHECTIATVEDGKPPTFLCMACEIAPVNGLAP